MFSRAIVRPPSPSFIAGLTTAQLGLPDLDLALQQHACYTAALRDCSLEVLELPADDAFPDATFVEDTALLTPNCAIISHPGAPSRRGEIRDLESVFREHYDHIERIRDPGTLEGGDVMMVGSHFYIGLSLRTNPEGARQLMEILERYGMSGSVVKLEKVLHLKTGMAYLEHNNLLVCGEFVTHPAFRSFNRIEIPIEESYAANCIWVNDTVLVPSGYPLSQQLIRAAGYTTLEVDVSEFRKLDGGLSCLSLRF